MIVDQTSRALPARSRSPRPTRPPFASGSTIYYRPAGGGGTFDVTDTNPTDANSGIATVRFPGLTGGVTPTVNTDDSAAPFTQTYSWTTGATDSGSKPITVVDAAGNTANTSFTLSCRLDGADVHDDCPGREREVPGGELSDRLVGHVHRRGRGIRCRQRRALAP